MLCNILLTIKIQKLPLNMYNFVLYWFFARDCKYFNFFFRFFKRKYADNSEHVEFYYDVHWIVSVSAD